MLCAISERTLHARYAYACVEELKMLSVCCLL